LPVGELLTVLTDDPVAAVDLPAWCWLRKQEYLGVSASDGGGSAHLVRRAT
jgi:cysteine desulfurase